MLVCGNVQGHLHDDRDHHVLLPFSTQIKTSLFIMFAKTDHLWLSPTTSQSALYILMGKLNQVSTNLTNLPFSLGPLPEDGADPPSVMVSSPARRSVMSWSTLDHTLRGPRCSSAFLHLLPLKPHQCEKVNACEQVLMLWHVGGIPSGEHTGVLRSQSSQACCGSEH